MKNLPTAIEAEKAIAGLLLNRPQETIEALAKASFQLHYCLDPLAKAVIALAQDRVPRNIAFDFVSVLSGVRQVLPHIQPHHLTDLSLDGAIFSALPSWIEIVQSTYQKRQSIIIANQLLQDLQGLDSPVLLLENAKRDFANLLNANQRVFLSWKDLLQKQRQVWKEGRDETKILRTGLKNLDKEMLIEASDMLVIGGGTGSGKTMLGLNIISNLMLQKVGPSILFTLEMTSGQVANRIVSNLSGVAIQKLKLGKLAERELEAVDFAVEHLNTWPIDIRDDCHTLDQIIAAARFKHSAEGLAVIMVDYLQLVKNSDRELREQQVADVSRSLRLLGLETGALIIAIIQLNSQGESRESKQILMDATQVLTVRLIDQDGDPLSRIGSDTDVDDSKRSLEIGKQRDGMVGMAIQVHFNGATSSFRS